MTDLRQKCVECKQPFETRKINQRYCSRKCGGAKGGRVKTVKGFATWDKEKLKKVSALGGSLSR